MRRFRLRSSNGSSPLLLSSSSALLIILMAAVIVVFCSTCLMQRDQPPQPESEHLKNHIIHSNHPLFNATSSSTQSSSFLSTSTTMSSSSRNNNNVKEERSLTTRAQELKTLVEKLQHPYELVMEDNNNDNNKKPKAHQFVHLHNMKTAGTSMDYILQCSMKRLKDDWNVDVPYYSLHECARHKYQRCRDHKNETAAASCVRGMETSAVISYCAPLHDLPLFGWDLNNDNDNHNHKYPSMTVLRHPVDRVWSMYRFETKTCYKCKSLLDFYKEMDAKDPSAEDNLCEQHLKNKETANMLTTLSGSKTASDEEILEQAIFNMKSWFTLVGLTEELRDFRTMVGTVFPWMNETLTGSRRKCRLTHSNKAPENNHCGADGMSHMDLSDHPDPETRRAIEQHNQLDLKLYAAAVDHFQLQREALQLIAESSR